MKQFRLSIGQHYNLYICNIDQQWKRSYSLQNYASTGGRKKEKSWPQSELAITIKWERPLATNYLRY